MLISLNITLKIVSILKILPFKRFYFLKTALLFNNDAAEALIVQKVWKLGNTLETQMSL